MNLSDITIVILSRGREEILRRTLTYWSNQEVNVVVIHNTDKPIDVRGFSGKLTYKIHRGSYGERCSIVPELLKTRFSILSADDELFLPSGLVAMKSALEKNESLTSVGGRTLAIGKYGPLITGANPYSNMNGYINSSDTSFGRIYNHYDAEFGNRIGGIYRLMDSKCMSQIMRVFGAVARIRTPYIFEVTGEILVNSLGDCTYLPNVYWLRNWINVPVRHRNWDRKLQFTSWVTAKEFANEVSEWKSTIGLEVGLSAKEIEIIVQRIIAVRTPAEENSPGRNNLFVRYIPTGVKAKVRKYFSPSTLPSNLHLTLEKMLENGAKFDLHEIESAVNFIS